MVKNIGFVELIRDGIPDKDGFVLTAPIYDIPSTVVAAIENLPDNCLAVTVFMTNDFNLIIDAAQRKGFDLIIKSKNQDND